MLDSLVQTVTAAILSAGGTGAILYFVLKHTMRPIDAYLEAKGKNLATHEDIMKLVDQVRETERVKAEITDNVWDRQQRWTAKHAMYRELMQALNSLFLAAVERDALITNKNSITLIQAANATLVNSYTSFVALTRIAGITVNQEAFGMTQNVKLDTEAAPSAVVLSLRTSLAELLIVARRDLGYGQFQGIEVNTQP